MIKVFLCGLAVCLGSYMGASAERTNTRSAPLEEGSNLVAVLDDHQKLGPGDRVTYRVMEDQDEPRAITITDSGDLEVPYLGLVHAAGKTSRDLAKEVKGLLEQKLYFRAT